MVAEKKWDLFISHAYEDKSFVRGLVDKLRELEIEVWYDDLVLKAGDSISASIDLGIANSDFGLAIFSKTYFRKFWTKEEIAGMRAREPLFGRTIIPVWLNIERSDVASFSPVLADRVGIRTDGRDSRHVATEIAKVVKPDALNRWLARSAFREIMKNSVRLDVDPKKLKKSPHRHKVLNLHQMSRIRILHAAVGDVSGLSFDSWVDNFKRDLYPDQEIIWWERLAGMYLAMLSSGLIATTSENKAALYKSLFGALNGQTQLLVDYLSQFPNPMGEKLAEIVNSFFHGERVGDSNLPENLSYKPKVS